jgi:hypothetical protein
MDLSDLSPFARSKLMNAEPFASYWLAAAEAGYAVAKDWAAWADERILESDSPPSWIIDLSLARTNDELWTILSPIIEVQVQEGFDQDLIHEAVLGYCWLRFERGDLDLRTCLDRAGRDADAYDTSIECEAIFGLLNRLDEGVPGAAVEWQARELFRSVKSLAERPWIALHHGNKGVRNRSACGVVGCFWLACGDETPPT